MYTFGNIIAVASLSAAFSGGIFQTITDYTNIFRPAGIVPDVVPSVRALRSLSVVFPDAAPDVNPYQTGYGYTTSEVARAPSLALDPAGAGTFTLVDTTFVAIVVDPDAPTPQDRSAAQTLHYVGTDLRITSSSTGGLTSPTLALLGWIAPEVKFGSAHRLTFLLYIQPSNFTQVAPPLLKNTSHFNLTTFASQTGLPPNPLAATFVLVGPDGAPTHSIAGQKAAFEGAGIVSDSGLLSDFDPAAVLDASFEGVNGSNFLVRTGENLTLSTVATAPSFFLSFNTSLAPQLLSQTYVLAILDPDAYTSSSSSVTATTSRLHMLAPNLHLGSTLTTYSPLINSTLALARYLAPTHAQAKNNKNNSPHRYVALLYVQPERFIEEAAPFILGPVRSSGRSVNWADFADGARLGGPVAGTFFRAGRGVVAQ